MRQEKGEIGKLVSLIKRLRDPERGCPWDRKQTMKDLKVYLIDEAYEVLEAIDSGHKDHLCEELGDLLFQIVFISEMAEEEGYFSIEDVVRGVRDKMIRRHPHVFGTSRAESPEEVMERWETIKETEGKGKRTSAISGIPRSLPALYRAYRLGLKAARVGFDWPDRDHVLDKVKEELGELEYSLASGDMDRASEELGDLLFAVANLARHMDREPEALLKKANEKFAMRFSKLEAEAARNGLSLSDLSPDQMEALWEKVKHMET